jgi:hypothetical protein
LGFGDLLRPSNLLARPKAPEEEAAPAAGKTPPHKRKDPGAVRLAALAEARAVLHELPAAGESLHAIMTGRYDMVDLVDALLERSGPVREMRIATLAFALRNVDRIQAWLAAGKVNRLTLLCSLYFQAHNRPIFQAMQEVLTPPHRLAASRNHCKVICLDCPDTGKWIIEGSANLRTNSNEEQFALFRDPGLCEWHSAWIEDRVSTYAARGTSD